MSVGVGVQDLQLWKLFRRVLDDVFRQIKEFQKAGVLAPRLSSYPLVQRDDQGLARITRDQGPAGVFDYSSYFAVNSSRPPKIRYSDLDGYPDLVEYCRTNDRLRRFLLSEALQNDGISEKWILTTPGIIALEIASRYLNMGGNNSEVDWTSVQNIYCEIEAWILADELAVDVLVPIVGMTFPESGCEIESDVYVEEFDDDSIAVVWPGRLPQQRYPVFGAPTHCLTIRNQKIANQDYLGWISRDGQESPYPKAVVDRFFEAAHMVCEDDVGYAQVVFRPVGWAPGYEGTRLPLVSGPLTGYTRFSWNDELTTEEAEDIQLFCRRLGRCSKNMRVASERFRMASQRDNDTDKIIDLCVALEALLGVDDKQEISYKLALRSAAVLATNGWERVHLFFSWVKQAYGYRSQVVHGAFPAEKNATIDLAGKRQPITSVVEFLLRALLRISFRRGTMNGKIADNEFVLPALAAYARSFNADVAAKP